MIDSLLTLYTAALGDFDLDEYRDAKALSWMTTPLFIIYTLALMIMLLNLLIGVMSDSFDKVRNQEKAEFLKGRASVIDDFEAGLTDDEIESLEKQIGTYIHALQPKESPQEMARWDGKISAFEKVVAKKFEQYSTKTSSEIRDLKEAIEQLKSAMASSSS